MRVHTTRALAVFAVAALGAACETSKSANPLSPSIAGPIPGVTITTPKPLVPAVGTEVPTDKQPLALVIENAGTTGVRPLALVVEVAADEGFTTKVFTRTGVTPGPNGRTELRLPDKLASDRTYFWRVKAQDGANEGEWSAPVKFTIFTPKVLHAPKPLSPIDGDETDDPEFRFRNASRSGPIGDLTYVVAVSGNPTFTAMVATFTGPERNGPGGETGVNASSALPGGATLFWRVRATDGTLNGPWSTTHHFRTAGGSDPGTGGGGGGGNAGTGNCASRDGRFIVNCISQKYASYRRAGVSSSQRRANMQFLRDRIIEAGLCGGLQLGWNLKRGGPELSIDFIAERRGNQTYGYDIAIDYDNTSKEMQLYWGEDGPGSHFKSFPNPNCNR